MKRWGIYLLLFFIGIFSPGFVEAAIQFTVDNALVSGSELSVNASISGLITSSCSSEGKCYLQGTLRQPAKNYFGQTQNNVGTWVDYVSSPELEYIQSTFFSFQPISGSWSGQVKMRFSTEDAEYKGPGDYELKLRRFSGNSKNFSGESNTLMVALTAALPTLTPTPTTNPTSTSTPNPTATPMPPTATATPTKVPTPTMIKTPTPTLTPTEQSITTPTATKDETPETTPMVLGETIESEPSSPSSFTQNNSWKPLVISLLLVATGLAILAVFYTWKIARKKFLFEKEKE